MSTRGAKRNLLYAGGNTIISSARMLMVLLLTTLVLALTCRLADAANTAVAYVTGSTHKICQLTGDYDKDANFDVPTANQTKTLYGVSGTDEGASFRHNGKTYFLFGDTPSNKLWRTDGLHDSVAWTTDTNPADGLSLTFINKNGTFTAPTVPGETLGGGEIPQEGISYNGYMYVYFATDTGGRCFLGKCTDEINLTFTKLYDLSSGKFKFVQVEAVDTASTTAYNSIRQYIPAVDQGKTILFVWGSGNYRASDPYLAYMVLSDIETKSKLRYFKGIDASNKPIWSTTAAETEAQPLFSQPCIGEHSVTWNPYLKKWLMLFNCGTPDGINYRVANYPWGPWSGTEVLFNASADQGICNFLHRYDCEGNSCDDNYDSFWGEACRGGGAYGPYVINDLTTGVTGSNTTIYFTLSTWNPYQVMLMKSTLQMVPPIEVTSPPNTAGVGLALNANGTVRWTAPGMEGYVKIELGRPACSGYTWTTLKDIKDSVAAFWESCPVFVPPGSEQNNCIIRVTSLKDTSIYGESDPFNLVYNQAPIAGNITISPASVPRGGTYSFSANGFSDPDGDTLTYWWGWQNPGSSTVTWWPGPRSNPGQTAPDSTGSYIIHCKAVDPYEAKSTEKTATLTVKLF
jgi:hypothetical protein